MTQPRAHSIQPASKRNRCASVRSKSGRLAWDKEYTRELFRQYKEEGSEEAREKLIENHMNLVRFLANKFKSKGESLEDLIQVGYIGLIKAVERFDPDRGLEFTTYATPTILGEIKRYFRDKGWSVRVPRRLQELSSKVNKATELLTKEYHRKPTVEELADYLDTTPEEVLEAIESSSAYNSVPLETGPDEDGETPSVLDWYADQDKDLVGADDRIILENALRDFSPREQEIIRLRFQSGLTQVQIAEQLGISQVQVSRILRKTLQKMRQKIDPDGVMARNM